MPGHRPGLYRRGLRRHGQRIHRPQPPYGLGRDQPRGAHPRSLYRGDRCSRRRPLPRRHRLASIRDGAAHDQGARRAGRDVDRAPHRPRANRQRPIALDPDHRGRRRATDQLALARAGGRRGIRAGSNAGDQLRPQRGRDARGAGTVARPGAELRVRRPRRAYRLSRCQPHPAARDRAPGPATGQRSGPRLAGHAALRPAPAAD